MTNLEFFRKEIEEISELANKPGSCEDCIVTRILNLWKDTYDIGYRAAQEEAVGEDVDVDALGEPVDAVVFEGGKGGSKKWN